jgi:hypothetical protein
VKLKKILFEILAAVAFGMTAVCLWILFAFIFWKTGRYPYSPMYAPLWLIALLGIILLSAVRLIFAKILRKQHTVDAVIQKLPPSAADYIKLVIKYMRYRKTARMEVADELADHFEESLKKCANGQEIQTTIQHLIDNFGNPKLLGHLMRRAKKRCRPLWRTVAARILQTIALMIIILIIYITWFFTGKPVITTDYVAQLNNLVRPSADDCLNASPLYNKAIETIDYNDVKEFLGVDPYDADAHQKETVKLWLAKNEPSLSLLTIASKMPYFWKQYRSIDPQKSLYGVMLRDVTDFRMITYAFCWRAWLRAEDGLYESAIDDIETCYRIGKHYRSSKTPGEQGIGTLFRNKTIQTVRQLLANYKIPVSDLAVLQQRLQNLIDDENFMPDFNCEIFIMSDEIQQCFTESRFGPAHIYPKRLLEISPELSNDLHMGKAENWFLDLVGQVIIVYHNWPTISQIIFTNPDKAESIAAVDDLHKFMDENFYKTPAQLKIEDINLEEQSNRILKNNLVLKIFIPSLLRRPTIAWQSKIDAESTLVIIALVRYRNDTGGYPESLDKLVRKGYIKQVPVDPFSDKPIAYRKTDNNFLLYSWGENLKDDNGQIIRDEKGKPKRFADEGDWVLWPVEKN